MEAIKCRPSWGVTPSNWANEITAGADDDLERLLAHESSRIATYLGFPKPKVYVDEVETQYDFDSKTVFLNRHWERNCQWQLNLSNPTKADQEHFACFCLAHELAHRFQNEYLTFEEVNRAPELFEAHADLVAAHLYRDKFQLTQECARFLVPAASSLQTEVSGGCPDYPPGCVRAAVVAAGMVSLVFPSDNGALLQPEKFFAASLVRAFELVVRQPRLCESSNAVCVGCRGQDMARFDRTFVGPQFESGSVADGARTLIQYYEELLTA